MTFSKVNIIHLSPAGDCVAASNSDSPLADLARQLAFDLLGNGSLTHLNGCVDVNFLLSFSVSFLRVQNFLFQANTASSCTVVQ